MFDTQFPWQPAVLVYLTYICAVCTQTRSNHLLLSRRAAAGEEPERLLNESMRDERLPFSAMPSISCVGDGWKSH